MTEGLRVFYGVNKKLVRRFWKSPWVKQPRSLASWTSEHEPLFIYIYEAIIIRLLVSRPSEAELMWAGGNTVDSCYLSM